jgi:hypothetical protein
MFPKFNFATRVKLDGLPRHYAPKSRRISQITTLVDKCTTHDRALAAPRSRIPHARVLEQDAHFRVLPATADFDRAAIRKFQPGDRARQMVEDIELRRTQLD